MLQQQSPAFIPTQPAVYYPQQQQMGGYGYSALQVSPGAAEYGAAAGLGYGGGYAGVQGQYAGQYGVMVSSEAPQGYGYSAAQQVGQAATAERGILTRRCGSWVWESVS